MCLKLKLLNMLPHVRKLKKKKQKMVKKTFSIVQKVSNFKGFLYGGIL